MGLVDAHSPLHGHALCGTAFGCKTVGVNLGLHGLPMRIKQSAVQRESAGQAQQGEVVGVEVHETARTASGPKQNPTTRWGCRPVRIRSDTEGFTAAAAIPFLGIVEPETFVQAFAYEVEFGAVDVGQALG